MRGNLYVIVALLMALPLSACMVPPSMLPDNTYVDGFGGVHTQHDFWVRQIEIIGKAEKFDVTTLPTAYRECVADQMVELAPPAVTVGVEKFIQSGLYRDYYPLVGEIKSFGNDFKSKRGMEVISYAGAVCEGKVGPYPDGDTYRAMLENAMALKWTAEGHPRSEHPKYFDCIINETLNTFSASEISELNSIAKSRTNLDRMKDIVKARDTRFGGSSDSQVLGKCDTLKNS